ncbi:ACP S-malonyltransferase [Akkermansia glycaniphila]|uniref:Malonyl CoA-acyl carrier protein transacylase n=1 Tax=Akkermansia glycaniphila TaxID=1679444 RepID=A0A1C7P951_9BACT|nr:ACP S-malonyltransferase [Akkermansia glycaniphila]MBT9450380.1 ACP S-malonyltransferase [Akkermansia glycaniphila]OCA02070.1 ACP S-malonyltransferase [Akkermansia glycaniphila]SEH93851.1 fabd: malonyl coa-acyl carrier protein transacylase [Akkermansia glycaniphila]
MKAVLLFSGQGAQKVGMGKDLYDQYATARALIEQADEALGFSLSDIMFEGPDAELTRTCYCQPALYVHGLACLAVLKEMVDIEPVAAAGLSLGEFTAHASVGTFSFADGLRIVQKRGAYMEEACNATKGTMAAMIGGSDEAAAQLAKDCGIDVANYNCPGQTVLSGEEAGIDQAIAGAKAAGIKIAKKLNVAGAYHSRLMKSAQEKLVPELAELNINLSETPVYCNYEARPVTDADDIRRVLGAQVCGSVRWTESMQDLTDKGERLFIELGPGKTLAGMMGRICKDATVISIEDVPSLLAAVEQLKAMNA